jgi:hypothetical protein
MLLVWGGRHIQASTLKGAPCLKNIGDGSIKWLHFKENKIKFWADYLNLCLKIGLGGSP